METKLESILERVRTYSAFLDHRTHLVTSGDLDAVVAAAQRALKSGAAAAVTLFDDATGERTEVEPKGSADAVRSRLSSPASQDRKPGPGRPRLGVVSREVSMLPRHWEWLEGQRGGASAALRRLVEEARKRYPAQDAARIARDAAAKIMTTLGGDQPAFEEALRALYRGEFARAGELIAAWPKDLRAHLKRLFADAGALSELAEQEAK